MKKGGNRTAILEKIQATSEVIEAANQPSRAATLKKPISSPSNSSFNDRPKSAPSSSSSGTWYLNTFSLWLQKKRTHPHLSQHRHVRVQTAASCIHFTSGTSNEKDVLQVPFSGERFGSYSSKGKNQVRTYGDSFCSDWHILQLMLSRTDFAAYEFLIRQMETKLWIEKAAGCTFSEKTDSLVFCSRALQETMTSRKSWRMEWLFANLLTSSGPTSSERFIHLPVIPSNTWRISTTSSK